jgi:hypothetical protein
MECVQRNQSDLIVLGLPSRHQSDGEKILRRKERGIRNREQDRGSFAAQTAAQDFACGLRSPKGADSRPQNGSTC